MVVRFAVLVCGFLLQLFPRSVSAFAVGSKTPGTAVSYGGAIDPNGVRIFTTGVDVDARRGDGSQCYVSVARATGYDSRLFSSPALCLDIHMLRTSGIEALNTAHANGLVTAMDGDEQPLLYKFHYANYHPNLEEPLEMPSGNFPALFTTEEEYQSPQDDYDDLNAGVYVALHPTNGITPSHVSNDNNMNIVTLSSMREYYRHFQHPRYTTNDGIGDIGYSPTVVKYNLETREEEWRLDFNTTEGKTLITGMGIVPASNRLVVFGSTTGYGMTVGAGAKPNGQNWMGFMTWVDRTSGRIDLSNYRSETHNSLGTPIRSQRNQDDMVLGMCLESDKAYVLGSTTGRFEGTENGGGFVWKLDTDRFDPTWKRQFVGDGVEFTHCVVHGNSVIVGGTVPPEGRLAPRNGHGADTENRNDSRDIVVAALDISSGATLWVRQIDSHLDDELVSLEKDHSSGSGGVYLTANAWDKYSTNALYALSIDLQGNHDWYQIPPTIDPITGIDSEAPPPINDNERSRPPNNNGSSQTSGTQVAGSSGMGRGRDAKNINVIIVGTIVPLVLLGIAIAIASFQKGTTNTTVPKTDESRQEPASGTTHDGDFDDVESIASENKLL